MSALTMRNRVIAAGVVAVTAAIAVPTTAPAMRPPDDGGGSGASQPGVPLPAFEHRRAATIQTDNGMRVAVRRRPRVKARIVLRLRGGDPVRIVCQKHGDTVTGKFGTSDLWNLVEIGAGRGAYVTDTYTFTGSDGQVAPLCPRGSGPPPPSTPETPPKGAAQRVLRWARGHVSWWAGKYSMDFRLPTDKTVRYMRHHQPPRGGSQGCDCSSFARWAMAQARVDIGTYTGNIWTANDRLPFTTAGAQSADGKVSRGYGTVPPGGWHKGDLVFWGVTGLDKDVGHVAIYSGKGRIIQCSGSRGSNAGSPIGSNGTPTGWIRYARVSG